MEIIKEEYQLQVEYAEWENIGSPHKDLDRAVYYRDCFCSKQDKRRKKENLRIVKITTSQETVA